MQMDIVIETERSGKTEKTNNGYRLMDQTDRSADIW